MELIKLIYNEGIIILLMLLISIFFRFLLQIFNQRWITTTSHTATLFVLPIIAFIITRVISGNIALSLGLVGALSIVRFRNPVRSPLELSVYFGAITMGIAGAVSKFYLIFLWGSITVAIASLFFINIVVDKFFKKKFFTTSFSEGNSFPTFEISTLKEIDYLDQSPFLSLKKKNKDDVQYILVAKNIEDLKKIENEIKNNSNIINYQLSQS